MRANSYYLMKATNDPNLNERSELLDQAEQNSSARKYSRSNFNLAGAIELFEAWFKSWRKSD